VPAGQITAQPGCRSRVGLTVSGRRRAGLLAQGGASPARNGCDEPSYGDEPFSIEYSEVGATRMILATPSPHEGTVTIHLHDPTVLIGFQSSWIQPC
jgi:hypothetical protein